MNHDRHRRGLRGRNRLCVGALEEVREIHPCAGAEDVGVVRRRADADGLGGTSEEMAHLVCQFL